MFALINRDDPRVNLVLSAVAWLLLLGCLAYNLYLIWATPHSGLTYDALWVILDVEACESERATCPDVAAPQPGDRMIQVGEISYSDYVADPEVVPFEGFLPGDLVPLSILRDGRTFQVDWQMQAVDAETIIRFGAVSLLVYGTFWLAGSYVLRYMRPVDPTWVLLITFFYLMTIWLAAGLYTLSNVASSAIILRIIGWLMAPVMIHLHVIVPGARLGRGPKALIGLLYATALLLLVLQLAGRLPWLAYLGGILIASAVGIALIVLRLATPRAPAEKLTLRLMLAGIVLALVPGLILSVVPLLLGLGTTDALGAAVSILALPMLPLIYTYAVYKHHLGLAERRVNRLLVQYTLVIIYFILLALVFVIISNWTWTANALLSIIVLVVLSSMIAFVPIRRPIETVFDRLSYGTRYSHRAILADFTERIPAAVDSQALIHLLKFELTPELEIRQSALLVRREDQVSLLFSQGVAQDDLPSSWAEVADILHNTESYMTLGGRRRLTQIDRQTWVRLAVPLRLKERTTGAWLLGRREKDDIYSQEDNDLLERLSGLVAVTLESSQLLEALASELETRRQAEARLAEQSARLHVLHQIDMAVLAARSPSEIAQAAYAGLRQLVPCIRLSVFLFDLEHDLLTFLTTQGSGSEQRPGEFTIPLPNLPAIDIVANGQVFATDAIASMPIDEALARSLVADGIQAVVSAPLIAIGSVFGALNVANDQLATYTPAQIAVVEEVAASVGLAIHNARLREELGRNSEQLRRLSTQLISAQESERKRLSHELHDEIGQVLTAISLNLSAVKRNLPGDSGDGLEEHLTEANGLVVGLTDQVRSLSLELRPSMLHDLGLVSTLRWYVANYARRNNVKVQFEAFELPERLPESVEITAYRIVQEALTNTSRHAQAGQVDLCLRGQDGNLQIDVSDDGRGFDFEANHETSITNSGIGLAVMRERVSAANGRLEVTSEPGKGTRILALIPIKQEDDK